ncbi:hypothetical protein QTP88_013120 [Uroleucon formosanum]
MVHAHTHTHRLITEFKRILFRVNNFHVSKDWGAYNKYTVARVDSLINRTRLYVETYKRRNAGIPVSETHNSQ